MPTVGGATRDTCRRPIGVTKRGSCNREPAYRDWLQHPLVLREVLARLENRASQTRECCDAEADRHDRGSSGNTWTALSSGGGQRIGLRQCQVALDPRTEQLVLGDVRVQTKRVMENIKAVLRAAGSSFEKITKTTVFLRDLHDFGAMNESYYPYFQEDPPARSIVQVSRLPRGAAVQIDVIALA